MGEEQTVHANCAWCSARCGFGIWARRTFITEFDNLPTEEWFEIRYFCNDVERYYYLNSV